MSSVGWSTSLFLSPPSWSTKEVTFPEITFFFLPFLFPPSFFFHFAVHSNIHVTVTQFLNILHLVFPKWTGNVSQCGSDVFYCAACQAVFVQLWDDCGVTCQTACFTVVCLFFAQYNQRGRSFHLQRQSWGHQGDARPGPQPEECRWASWTPRMTCLSVCVCLWTFPQKTMWWRSHASAGWRSLSLSLLITLWLIADHFLLNSHRDIVPL